MRKNTILAAAGVLLFGFVISKVGWASMIPQLKSAWIGLPMIVGLSFLRLLMQTSSWATALRAEGIMTTTGELMGLRLAAQGAGYISVLGPALSEPMKIRLLGGDSRSATVATLVDTGAYWFASALFGIFACIAAALLVAQSRRTVVLLAVLAAAFFVGLMMIARPKPLLSPIVRALGARCPSWLCKGERFEAAIRSFGSRHPEAIRKMFWLDLGCQVLLAAEVVAIFWTLAIPFRVGTVLALEAANRGLKIVTGWMPARIGADEGATAGTFAALGLSSASGLALALTRRLRDLLACGIGFAWLTWRSRINISERREFAICKP